MKKLQKILAVLLVVLMTLSLAACGGKDNKVVKIGVLDAGGLSNVNSEAHGAHMGEKYKNFSNVTIERVEFNNLSAALMDLESGKLTAVSIEESTANYVTSRNDKIAVTKNDGMTNFSMMTMDSNKIVSDILNNAIKEMKADGTLDALVEKELTAYIESDPVAKDLPKFDGAKTIKIGITGDLPPMDFVSTDGKAAGFNIALLTEIANRAQVNIELVQIETSARPMALSSGKVDAVFWTKSATCTVCGAEGAEKIDGTFVTESYFSDRFAMIMLKSAK